MILAAIAVLLLAGVLTGRVAIVQAVVVLLLAAIVLWMLGLLVVGVPQR